MNKWITGMLVSGILLTTSCNENDADKELTNQSPLVGTWTYESSELTVDINGQDIVDYFIELLGLTEEQAIEFASAFTEETVDFESVSWEFKADQSFIITDPEATTIGTWSLSEDGNTLTLTSDGEVEVVQVQSISASRFELYVIETNTEDFDEDGTDDTITIEVSLTLKK